MRLPTVKRVIHRVRVLTQRRLECFSAVLPLVQDKSGLEIGGPSGVFRKQGGLLPLYEHVASLDNCDISANTVWAVHSNVYNFSSRKAPGKTIFCDGSDLSCIADGTYDFILSSHNLEHFANPVKALKEWKRVTRPKGALILVLPNYSKTFDHRRLPTTIQHMFEDFGRNIQENDLSHLTEVLSAHDLNLDRQINPDLAAKSAEEFRTRLLNNFTNRCLHHHVFDENNSRQLLTAIGMDVLAVELAFPFHIFLLARMP